jgi:YidC/Oxa1 family membrane protein insertase
MISFLFYQLFYRPILNLLVLFIHYLPGKDFGLAVLFLTIVIRLILLPLNIKAQKEQKKVADLQPKMKEIQEKYGKDKEKLSQEALKLFQEKKVNPFFGIFLTFIQLPVLIALFFVLKNINNLNFNDLYSFVPKIEKIKPVSFGFLDLSKSFLSVKENKTTYYWQALPLLLFSSLAFFFQMRGQQKRNPKDPSERFQRNFFYFIFGTTLIVLIQLPLAIALYLLVSSIFSLIEQRSVFKIQKNG